MVIPFIAWLLGLFVVSMLHTFLTPVADGLFAASMNSGDVMILIQAAWDYFPILYAFVGAIILILYARKSGGGGAF